MQKPSLIVYGLALLVPPLVASHPAEAGLLVGGVVGSSATGAIKESFDSLAPWRRRNDDLALRAYDVLGRRCRAGLGERA